MNLRSIHLICLLTGIAVTVTALIILPSDLLFLNSATKAEGTVIQLQTSAGNTDYRPVVDFSTEEGQKIKTVSQFNASPKQSLPQVGEKVQVYYQPDNPEEARLINLHVDLLYLGLGLLTTVVFFYLGSVVRLVKHRV